jgi:alkanesulfonate monooxygenase SsuD/methylene tetrahydromethanopterin reductase-like flavin-dependent oxidoreductase (luciferase family)
LPGGEGRAIRSSAPARAVPIYVASLGPANLSLTGRLADGWIGTAFMPETAATFREPIRLGAASAGRALSDLELTVPATVELTADVEGVARRHARGYAFTIGAMGSETTNFYNDAFERQGYADDVRAVQRLWLSGDTEAARRRVPTAFGLGTNLIGTDDLVKDRLRRYRRAGMTTLRVSFPGDPEDDLDRRMVDLERLLSLVRTVNDET